MALNSEEWRLRGNGDFEEANSSPFTRDEHYNSALLCYKHAMDLAETNKQFSSAAKNFALTSLKLVDYFSNKQPWNKDERIKHMAGALEFYSKAVSRGTDCQSEEWTDKMEVALKSCLLKAYRLAEEFQGDEKAWVLQTLAKEMISSDDKVVMLLRVVDVLHAEAIESHDDCKARDLLVEAIKCLERAKVLGGQTEDWEEKVETTRKAVNGKIELRKATTILDNITKDGMHDVDALFWAIDSFVNAIKLSEDGSKEVEAEAYSKLGKIYDVHLKNTERAKIYYRKCIFIADNIQPKTYLQQDWYLACTTAMKNLQKKVLEESADAEYNARKKYLEELKDELEKLKKKSKEGVTTMLAFIVKEYPPKSQSVPNLDSHKLRGLDTDDLRREVLRLVMKYHPDRQKDADKKWKVLCEEITKHLNNMLEKLKLQT